MKNSKYLIILLALALLFVCYKWVSSTSSEPVSAEPTENATIHDIMTRTSVRSYTDQPVEEATLDTLLRCAMAAPTAANKRPWRFVVINERAILDTISVRFKNMGMAAEAPVAVVLCGDTESTLDGQGRDFWVQDVSASAENMLLAAHALGLGAVWCGIYPMSDRVGEFKEMLNLPDNIIPMACVCIGYPSGNPTPKDKWTPDNIHYNAW